MKFLTATLSLFLFTLVPQLCFGTQVLLEQELATKGYEKLFFSGLVNHRKTFVDQIYQNGERAIFLKVGVRPKESSQRRKLNDHPRGYYYADTFADGTPYSLFFYQIPKKEAPSLIEKISGAQKTSRLPWPALLVPAAWAEGTLSCEPQNQLKGASQAISNKTLGDIAWTCSAAAGDGASTRAQEAIASLNPSQWSDFEPRAFWDQSVKTYEAIKELLPQLKPILAEYNDLLKNLHPHLKINLVCSAIGAQSIELITPGGVAKKLTLLKSKLEALRHQLQLLKGLSKLYEKYPHSQTLEKATQRIGACIL